MENILRTTKALKYNKKHHSLQKHSKELRA